MTYEPKIIAVCALALACFSVGFSTTAAAMAASGRASDSDARAETAAHAPLTVAQAAVEGSRGCNHRVGR